SVHFTSKENAALRPLGELAQKGQCCHDQCLGGCSEPGNSSSCVSCRNLQHGNTCVDKCPAGFYVFRGWRCISFSFCQELHNQCTQSKKLNQDREQGCHEYVIHNGACIPECPSGYTTINSTTTGGTATQGISVSVIHVTMDL
ncbi:hypothetical protein KUCAC02_020493, partial [Chaenocephalus aceratus]